MHYRTLWVVRHVMPDDRLATVSINPAPGRDPDTATIAIALRYGHVHADLAQAWSALSKSFADHGPFELDPDHDVRRPELQTWIERVDERHTGNAPMQAYFGGVGPHFFEILVNKDLVDPALIREMNEEVMPVACGVLVPASYADWE
jgi:hypothetical protein